MTFIKIFRDDMLGDADPPRYVSKAKLTCILKNSFYLSENLVPELLFIIFFLKNKRHKSKLYFE